MKLNIMLNPDLVEKISKHRTTSVAAFIVKAVNEYIKQLEKDMSHTKGNNNEKKTLPENTI